MAQPPGTQPTRYRYDLDVIAGPEVWIKLDGEPRRFYAVFSNRDVAHYRRLVDREEAHTRRAAQAAEQFAEWANALRSAEQDGAPPPLAPQPPAFGPDDPSFYVNDEYERDLYNLLLSVWAKSERVKPEHERQEITVETVRDITDTQARALLECLWLSRIAPRVTPPAADPQPASPAPPTEAATSTASTAEAPSPKARKRRASPARTSET